MKAEEILRTAADLVSGPRAEQHGDVDFTFGTASTLFEGIVGQEISPTDGIMFMVCLKIARMVSKRNSGIPINIDDYIDACGYLALAGQLESEDK